MEIKSIDEYAGLDRKTTPSPNAGIAATWSSRSTGVWLWFAQRIAAVVTFTLILLHLHAPFSRRLQFSLLAALLFHAVIGARVMLIDYGIVSTKYQKVLFVALLLLGALIFVLVYRRLW